MTFQIERSIPLPTPRMPKQAAPKKVTLAATFRRMRKGDSVLVTERTAKSVSVSMVQATQQTGHKFTYRTVEGGVRVWRVS